MKDLTAICVFCGSSEGKDAAFTDAAIRTGTVFAQQNIRLVYGGSSVGMMGALAHACAAEGGDVIGVHPAFLQAYEAMNDAVGQTIVANDLYERKHLMIEQSDGFLVLPGGLGTLDELFEVWTQVQLDRQTKPIGILNIKGFFDPLLAAVKTMQEAGFLNQDIFDYIQQDTEIEPLLDKMRASQTQSFIQEKMAFRRRDA